MKKIICFGDSNTFGFNPKNGTRHDQDSRWTGVLAQILRETFQVIEEGCNNRTGFCNNPDGLLQTGSEYLPLLLEKHDSFDIFIIALGTNDLQKIFNIDPKTAQKGLKNLTSLVKKACSEARIVLIPPILLSSNILDGYFSHQFDETSIKSSAWIQSIYDCFAREEKCDLIDINKIVEPSSFDGLHFDEEAHRAIAKHLANHILG